MFKSFGGHDDRLDRSDRDECWCVCVVRVTAVPDEVRLPGAVRHGDRASENTGRSATSRASATEDGGTTTDWRHRPRHTRVDDEASLWRPGHVGRGTHALCWSREFHAQQRTMAYH